MEKPPSIIYDKYLAKSVFAFQNCSDCNGNIFPPRVICHKCGSDNLKWKKFSGLGTIYSLTSVQNKNNDNVQVVVMVDIVEGIRLLGDLINLNPDPARIGDRVEIVVKKSESGNSIVFTRESVSANQ